VYKRVQLAVVRLALVENEYRIRQATRSIAKFLK
jgi:hypothetical protein